MNESSESNTSILLPSARVGLYVLDSDLREAAKTLADDWRFARVTLEIHEGDVETAIQAYQGNVSPELLMVETKTIDDGFAQRLEILAGNCAEPTSAVVVGPVNDVYLYRKLINMGVSDYLVKPIRKDVLAEVIAKGLIEKLGTSDSRLIAFVGSKGGVGTSVLAQAAAWTISARLDQKTIILDASGGGSYLSVAMGTEPVTTLAEAARAAGSTDQDSFRRMIATPTEKLSVLASGADSLLDEIASPEAFEGILNRLMTTYPVVIADLSGATAAIKKMVMHKAHEVVIVTTPTLPALRSARSLLNEIKEVRGGSAKEIELVVNMKDQAPGLEVSLPDIVTAMGCKPLLSVPFLPKLFAGAETQGRKMVEMAGSEAIVSGLVMLARKVIQAEEITPAGGRAEGNLLGGLLGKLKKK